MVKRVCSFLFLLFFCNIICRAQAVVSGSVGVNATYATLSAAFTAINGAAAQTGSNIIITITTDLSEPVTPTALIYKSWTTLTIKPSGVRTISGTPTNQLIGFNGAKFVTIDGLAAGGNSLLINCTNNQPALVLYNAASNNTVKNLTIKANTNSLTTGVIFFSNTTAGGDNNNAVDNCDITASTSGSAINLVYSNGSAGAVNKTDTIRNCRLYDNFNATGNSNSILLDANNDSWVIEDNHYYQTASRTVTSGAPVYTAININGCIGDNFKIDNNAIGGTSTTHSGYSTYGPNTQAASVKGIILNNVGPAAAAYPSNSYVTNNTIKGIQVNSNKFSTVKGNNTFVGIEVNNGATTDEAYITNNTVGGFSFTALIKIEATSTTANQVPCAGIYNRSSKGNFIDYNTIGSISMYQTAASAKTTTFDAIYSDPTTNSSTSISYNSIGGYVITTVYSAARVYGIELGNTAASGTAYTVMHNTISNLEHTAASVSVNYPLAGINCVGGGDQPTIAYNNIYSITLNGTISTAEVYAAGIRVLDQTGAGAQPSRIYKNKIFYVNAPGNTNGNSGVIGISLIGNGTDYVYDNMIAIGENCTTSKVLGINQNNGNTAYIYNNSIYIPGLNSGFGLSACLRKASNTNTTYAINNIFQIERQGYGVFMLAAPLNATPYVGNNNIFYAPNGNCGYINGSNYYQLSSFQAAIAATAGNSEGVGSKEAEVTFTSLPLLNTQDPDVINAGMNLLAASALAITDDIDDEPRNACFDIGADEVYFRSASSQLTWTGSIDTKWCTPCNWDYGVSPDSQHTVFIDSGFARYPVIDAAHNCSVTGLPQADSVTIASGASLTVNSSALEIFGQLNNNGTLTNPAGSMGFASYIKNQEINSDTDLVFNNLYIRGASTKKYLNRDASANSFAHCGSCSANLLLGTNNLSINTSATGSLNSHVVTNGTGTLIMKSVNLSTLLPIGPDETHYNPLTIASGNGKDYAAKVQIGINPGGTSNPLLGVNRTWNIVASATPPSTVTVTFNYYDADVNASCAPHTNMDLGHYYYSPIPIWNVDQSGNPVTVAAFNSVTFGINNWNSSNPFIVGNAGIILAKGITINLSVGQQSNNCRLTWNTTGTLTSGHFEILHSTDGSNFSSIGVTNIISASSQYSFTHFNAGAGSHFYKVRLINTLNGTIYSNIVLIAGNTNNQDISIYPSPAASIANLRVNSDKSQTIKVRLLDPGGRVLILHTIAIAAGRNNIPLDIRKLAAGIYVVAVDIDAGSRMTRLVKE